MFIGDVKLAELKMFLTRAGFYTELTGGLLVCNRVVSIRKVLYMHARARVCICVWDGFGTHWWLAGVQSRGIR